MCVSKKTAALLYEKTVMKCLALQFESVTRGHSTFDITIGVQCGILLHGHKPGDSSVIASSAVF